MTQILMVWHCGSLLIMSYSRGAHVAAHFKKDGIPQNVLIA